MIGFLAPAWLWALPAVFLPLILHLVARRQPPTLPFPAVRYLQQVTRDHQRRLKLRNWLLLLVRTLLILTLVLAAAGPTVARDGLAGHAPAALVLVVDNSPSSGAVGGGTPMLDRLKAAAREVLAKATGEDAIWLVTATGVARRAPAALLRAAVDSLEPSDVRLDLGTAVSQAGDLLANDDRPGEVIVLSDLQASAVTAAAVAVPVLVALPEAAPPPNLGIARLEPGPQPWPTGENRVRALLGGDTGRATPMTMHLGPRAGRPMLAEAGRVVEAPLTAPGPGWWPLVATLDPDEFRADDQWQTLVRVQPVAAAQWNPGDRYLAAAAATLLDGGRLRPGTAVTLGWLGPGPSIVEPPEDLAALGALNRSLERRGVSWRFGGPVLTEQLSDSGALVGTVRVHRRLRLQQTGGAPRGIEATVGGEPWIVRSADVVLLGSRFDPAWSALPTSAGFVPLVDVLANRVVRGEQALLNGTPGDPVFLPDAVEEVFEGARSWRVEGGAPWRPPGRGTFLLRNGADTIGALAVNLDPRESLLATATAAQVRAAWPSARVVELAEVRSAAFGAGARGHFRAPLLLLALFLGLVEVALASGRRSAA
ncbi:MAG TPA: BatA and WFA domain-containing protein [Gemmatimonadales bacterium]|nr:BatA and WFA domain-containing protein [Gemmatimonadales bacterium]